MKNKKTYQMIMITMLIVLELLMAMTPLGYIPIGGIRATTLHLPVILAGVLFGYKSGALLGLVFGLSSIIMNTMQPTPFSFIFSPFYSLGEISGGLASIVIALVPRMLIGIVSAYVYQLLKKTKVALPVAGVVGSMTSTILVLLGIYVFFKEPYAASRSISTDLVAGVLLTQLTVNGVLEALVALVATTVLGNVGLRLLHNK